MSYAVIHNPEDYSYVLKDVELVELNLIDEMKMEFFLNNIDAIDLAHFCSGFRKTLTQNLKRVEKSTTP